MEPIKKLAALKAKLVKGLSPAQWAQIIEEIAALILQFFPPTPAPSSVTLHGRKNYFARIGSMKLDNPTPLQLALQQFSTDLATAINDQISAQNTAAQVETDTATLATDTTAANDAATTFSNDLVLLQADLAAVEAAAGSNPPAPAPTVPATAGK